MVMALEPRAGYVFMCDHWLRIAKYKPPRTNRPNACSKSLDIHTAKEQFFKGDDRGDEDMEDVLLEYDGDLTFDGATAPKNTTAAGPILIRPYSAFGFSRIPDDTRQQMSSFLFE